MPSEELSPQQRAQAWLESLSSREVQAFDATQVYEQLLRSFLFIRDGRLDFGGAAGVWTWVRAAVDLTLRKYRDEAGFRTTVAALPHARRRRLVAPTLATLLRLPASELAGVAPIDVGAVAALIIETFAPELSEVIPPGLRRKPPPEVGFTGADVRDVIREELGRVPTTVRPEVRRGGITFRPGDFLNPEGAPPLPAELQETVPAPEPPPTPAQEQAEIELPPAAPLPGSPVYPSPAMVGSFGRRELEAAWRLWTQLEKEKGIIPPADVVAAARARWQVVFKFGAPAGLVGAGPAPPTPTAPAPAPPPVRRAGGLEGFTFIPESVPGEQATAPPPEPPAPVPPPQPEEVSPAPPEVPLEESSLEASANRPLSSEASVAERYRPRYLEEIVGNRGQIRQLEAMVREGRFPSCILLYGPPGTGKSTAAQALVRSYFRRQGQLKNIPSYQDRDLSLPDVGVAIFGSEAATKAGPTQFLHGTILPAIRTLPVGGANAPRRFIIIDDVLQDIPQAVQRDLLSPLEAAERRGNATIIFTTNHIEKVIPPLRSRCTEGSLEIRALPVVDVQARLKQIAEAEGWTFRDVDQSTREAALESHGDLRAAIGILNRIRRSESA